MFCIKSDVVTLRSIEMYGLVTVWTSMDDGPYWVILLKYGSHDMRHTGFRRLTVVNGTSVGFEVSQGRPRGGGLAPYYLRWRRRRRQLHLLAMCW